MDFKNVKWNKSNYDSFIKYLKSLQDKNYQAFHKRILNDDNINLIGIRMPIIKKISKDISKGDYNSFIKYNRHIYYEENIIHGLILGYVKVGEDSLFKLIDDFLPYIDNWATCDSVCCNLKQFKKININNIERYLNSDEPYIVRFGLVLLLDHYIYKENLNYIYDKCNKNKIDHYYVKMAISWLISIVYIKYPKETYSFLKSNNLDSFVQNKAISKICDSFRVNKEEKEIIRKLKVWGYYWNISSDFFMNYSKNLEFDIDIINKII